MTENIPLSLNGCCFFHAHSKLGLKVLYFVQNVRCILYVAILLSLQLNCTKIYLFWNCRGGGKWKSVSIK